MAELNFMLYPIYWIANSYEDEEKFDTKRLPLDVMEGITIEDVSSRFREDAFIAHREHLGTDVVEEMEGIQYALVLRYGDAPQTERIRIVGQQSAQAERKLRTVFACLQIIRPMRERAQPVYGTVRGDGSFDVTGFFVPPQHILEVPTVQKLFKLRNQDADQLTKIAPLFLETMEGTFGNSEWQSNFMSLGIFSKIGRHVICCGVLRLSPSTRHTVLNTKEVLLPQNG